MGKQQVEELIRLMKEQGYDTKEIFKLIEVFKKTPVVV